MKSFSNSEKKMTFLKSKEHSNRKAKGSAGVETCLTSEQSVLRQPLHVTTMIYMLDDGQKEGKQIKKRNVEEKIPQSGIKSRSYTAQQT